MSIINFLFLVILLLIFYQDIRTRLVWWWLFPLVGILGGAIYYFEGNEENFLYNIGVNLVITSTILGILYLYATLVLRKKFFEESFGLGDVLLFYALSFCFPSLTFIILFSFSMLFSSVLFIYFKGRTKISTVPLAGFMALFFALIIIVNMLTTNLGLYLY